MSKKKKLIIIVAIIFLLSLLILLFYWLLYGRTVVINLGSKNLEEIVDLSCFEGLHADMTRTNVNAALGQPWRMYVTDIEYDKNGEIEYQEICWSYRRESSFLNYYVEEYDVPGGSVEYIPEHMRVSDFFRLDFHVGLCKRIVEINNDDGHHLLTVSLKGRDSIKRINWYQSK
jgi:hypothetical protein